MVVAEGDRGTSLFLDRLLEAQARLKGTWMACQPVPCLSGHREKGTAGDTACGAVTALGGALLKAQRTERPRPSRRERRKAGAWPC